MPARSLWLRFIALLFSALSASGHAQAETAAPLAEFRSKERGATFDIVLKETERQSRVSVFTASAPISDQPKALFLLCSLSEFVGSRGYTHLAVIEPTQGGTTYVVGLFDSEDEALHIVFGRERDLSRVLGARPGAVAQLNILCGRAPK